MKKPYAYRTGIVGMGVIIFCLVVLSGLTASAQISAGVDRLRLAEDFASQAVKRATEAMELCETKRIREALALTDEAIFMTSLVAAEAVKVGDLKLARSAYSRTRIIGEAFQAITGTCVACCNRNHEESGDRGPHCCDCDLLEATLRVGKEIAQLSMDAVKQAQETKNKKLGQTACLCANSAARALADLTAAYACCSQSRGDEGGAGCCCDCDLPLETVRLAQKVAFVLLEETEIAQKTKDEALAGEAYSAGNAVAKAFRHMTESWMSWMLCSRSGSEAKAWLCFCDCPLIEDAMTLAETIELLISRAAGLAEREKEPGFIQGADDMAHTFDKALEGIGRIATHCYRNSMELVYVNCCRKALDTSKRMAERNNAVVEKLTGFAR